MFFYPTEEVQTKQTKIAVITVEPAIIFSFVNKLSARDERVKTSVKTMKNDPFASFVRQTAENCKKAILLFTWISRCSLGWKAKIELIFFSFHSAL